MHSVSVLVQCLKVNLSEEEWWTDLPELTSIRLGVFAFDFKDAESTELIMRSGYDEMNLSIDLPKLTSLTTEGDHSGTFLYPRSITLESISYHSILTNRHAFSHHCYSPSCIRDEEPIVLQEYSQFEKLMNRHWWIGESSKHSYAQSPRECSFCWRIENHKSKYGSDDCG